MPREGARVLLDPKERKKQLVGYYSFMIIVTFFRKYLVKLSATSISMMMIVLHSPGKIVLVMSCSTFPSSCPLYPRVTQEGSFVLTNCSVMVRPS